MTARHASSSMSMLVRDIHQSYTTSQEDDAWQRRSARDVLAAEVPRGDGEEHDDIAQREECAPPEVVGEAALPEGLDPRTRPVGGEEVADPAQRLDGVEDRPGEPQPDASEDRAA